MEPLEKVAEQMKAALRDPRRPAGEISEMVSLYDNKGNVTRRPPIVAKEILKAQRLTPRDPKDMLFEAPPGAHVEPVQKPPDAKPVDAHPLADTVDPAEGVADDGFACDVCGRSFKTEAGMKRHRTTQHKD